MEVLETLNTLQQQVNDLNDLILICFVSTWVVLASIAYLINNIHDKS